MENKTKKVLTTTAVAAALAAGTVATTNNVHAATVQPNANEVSNNSIEQAQQRVDQATDAQQTAKANDDQAATDLNNAQADADSKQAANDAAQTALNNNKQAVDQATTDLNNAQANQSAVSDAIANHDKVQSDLNQAHASQSAIAQENADGHLDQAVSDAQQAASSAQTDLNNAQSANDQAQSDLSNAKQALADAGQTSEGTTQEDVDAAKQAVTNAQNAKSTADQHVNLINSTETTINQDKEKLSEVNNKIDNLNKQLNNSNTSATPEQYEKGKQALQATVKVPDNFVDMVNSMVDMSLNDRWNGKSWASDYPDYARALIRDTKQSQSNFVAQIYDILSNYDPTAYDTVVDISSGILDGPTMAKLSQFAADVLNVYRNKLGEQDLKVNAVLIANTLHNMDEDNGTHYAEAYAKSLNLPLSSLLSLTDAMSIPSLTRTGHASSGTDIASNKVEYDAYHIMGHPKEYSMDQLYLSVYNQITSCIATDGVLPSETDKFDTIHAGHDGAPNHEVNMGLLDDTQYDTPQNVSERVFPSNISNAYVYYWINHDDYPTLVNHFITKDGDAVNKYYYNPLTESLIGSSNKNTDLNDELNNQRRNRDQIVGEINNLQDKLSQLKEQYPEAKKVADDAAIALTNAQTKLADVKAAFNHDSQSAAEHDAKVAQLQQAVKDAQTKATQNQAVLDNANTQLTNAKTALQDAQSKLNDWNSRKKAADNKVNDLQKALDHTTQADLDAATQAVKDAQAKLDAAKAKLAQSQKDADKAKADLEAATTKLQAAKDKKDGTAKTLDDANQALAQAKQALVTVEAVHGNGNPGDVVTPTNPSKDNTPETPTAPNKGTEVPADTPAKDNSDEGANTPVVNVPADKSAADTIINNGATRPVNVENKKNGLQVAAVTTREAYNKAQQLKQNANSDTLPQTGNNTNEAGLLSGLLLIGLTMFGFGTKRKF